MFPEKTEIAFGVDGNAFRVSMTILYMIAHIFKVNTEKKITIHGHLRIHPVSSHIRQHLSGQSEQEKKQAGNDQHH